MTEQKPDRSSLNPLQKSRAESVKVAASVLTGTLPTIFGGGKNPIKAEGVQDLLTVADWIYADPIEDVKSLDALAESLYPAQTINGTLIPISPDKMPSLFEALSHILENCNQPDCLIHGPSNAAKDIKPEDAGTPEPKPNPETPVDFDNPEQTGMAEASDFVGGEADSADENPNTAGFPWEPVGEVTKPGNPFPNPHDFVAKKPVGTPPTEAPTEFPLGTTKAVNGRLWQVVHSNAQRVWLDMGPLADSKDDDIR